MSAYQFGPALPAGWIDRHFIQILVQLAGIVAAITWTFGVTFGLAKVFQYIPGMNLRVTPDDEMIGCDITLCGEVAYDFSNSGAVIGN